MGFLLEEQDSSWAKWAYSPLVLWGMASINFLNIGVVFGISLMEGSLMQNLITPIFVLHTLFLIACAFKVPIMATLDFFVEDCVLTLIALVYILGWMQEYYHAISMYSFTLLKFFYVLKRMHRRFVKSVRIPP